MKQAKVAAVIGAGSAGMSAYQAIKRGGDSCFLIENHLYGTTCARTGCMPSKLLIAAANSRHNVDKAELFGIDVDGVKVNRSNVMRRVRRERERFVNFVLDLFFEQSILPTHRYLFCRCPFRPSFLEKIIEE